MAQQLTSQFSILLHDQAAGCRVGAIGVCCPTYLIIALQDQIAIILQ